VVTQEEAITGFDQVDISHGFEVDISQGDTFRVVVRVDDNLVRHLKVGKLGNTLQIGFKRNSPNIQRATLQAEVIMPELTGLDLSSSSHANIAGFKSTEDLSLDLSSGSSLHGDIEAGDILIDLSSGSEMALVGSGQDVAIEASSTSTLDLSEFAVVNARVDASSESTVTVNASGRLDVEASSGSDVHYLGDPTIGEIDTSSGASVEPQ
jgi:hypothetical protein